MKKALGTGGINGHKVIYKLFFINTPRTIKKMLHNKEMSLNRIDKTEKYFNVCFSTLLQILVPYLILDLLKSRKLQLDDLKKYIGLQPSREECATP